MNIQKAIIRLIMWIMTCLNIKNLQYVAVVGYDKEYIYLVDSTSTATNVYGTKQYNRRLTYDEFEEMWSTDGYPFGNIY